MGRGSGVTQASGQTLLFGRRRPGRGSNRRARSDRDYLQAAEKLPLATGPWRDTRQANVILARQLPGAEPSSWIGIGVRQARYGAKTPFGEIRGSTRLEFCLLQGAAGIDPWKISHTRSLDAALKLAEREAQRISTDRQAAPTVSFVRFEQAFVAREVAARKSRQSAERH